MKDGRLSIVRSIRQRISATDVIEEDSFLNNLPPCIAFVECFPRLSGIWISLLSGGAIQSIFSMHVSRCYAFEAGGDLMSASNESTHWVERNWYYLVILYGLLFLTLLVSFAPSW